MAFWSRVTTRAPHKSRSATLTAVTRDKERGVGMMLRIWTMVKLEQRFAFWGQPRERKIDQVTRHDNPAKVVDHVSLKVGSGQEPAGMKPLPLMPTQERGHVE